jgi:hypothetical protein
VLAVRRTGPTSRVPPDPLDSIGLTILAKDGAQRILFSDLIGRGPFTEPFRALQLVDFGPRPRGDESNDPGRTFRYALTSSASVSTAAVMCSTTPPGSSTFMGQCSFSASCDGGISCTGKVSGSSSISLACDTGFGNYSGSGSINTSGVWSVELSGSGGTSCNVVVTPVPGRDGGAGSGGAGGAGGMPDGHPPDAAPLCTSANQRVCSSSAQSGTAIAC